MPSPTKRKIAVFVLEPDGQLDELIVEVETKNFVIGSPILEPLTKLWLQEGLFSGLGGIWYPPHRILKAKVIHE